VLANHAAGADGKERYFRTASLLSPDGILSAYSRIQMDVTDDLQSCRVSSILFIENLDTGTLQVLNAHSPLACQPWQQGSEGQRPGTIAILMPLGWNAEGTQLLAREFEGLFCSSCLTDYAVVWDRHQNQHWTLVPEDFEYDHSILLGWSQQEPNAVLFRAGQMGSSAWPKVAVSPQGTSFADPDDQPVWAGTVATSLWMGPQANAS
jgi:hypothetical protein